jgi:hypothetical protein
MDQTSKGETAGNAKKAMLWIAGFLVLLFLSMLIGWFNDSTELLPNHEDVENACLVAASLCGLIFGVVGTSLSKNLRIGRRVAATLCFAVMGFIAALLIVNTSVEIIEGRIDFPPAATKSRSALLAISSARHHVDSRSQSWSIHAAPYWADLEITQHDYEFMLKHRRPGDSGHDPDEVSSDGYFCARVTVQQSGNALRVMHAGSHALPSETVIVCPPLTRDSPM